METMTNLYDLYIYLSKLSKDEAFDMNGELEIQSNLLDLAHRAPCIATCDIFELIGHLNSAINITRDRKLVYELDFNVFGCAHVSDTYELKIRINLKDKGCLFDATLYLLDESIQYLKSRYDKKQIKDLVPIIPKARYFKSSHDTDNFTNLRDIVKLNKELNNLK